MKQMALNDWMGQYIWWFNEKGWRQPPDWHPDDAHPDYPNTKYAVPHIERFDYDDPDTNRETIEFYWKCYRNLTQWGK